MPFPPPPFPHDSLGLLLKTIWKVFREKKIFCFPGGMLLSCWRKVKPNYPHPDTPPTEEYMYCFSHNKNKYFRLRLTFNISWAPCRQKDLWRERWLDLWYYIVKRRLVQGSRILGVEYRYPIFISTWPLWLTLLKVMGFW